jgi:peptidyl-prolyl cis-trans isomerase SurA
MGKFSKGDNEVVDGIKWEKGVTDIIKHNDQFVVVEVIEKLAPRAKELEEVRGLVTSDYQSHLEKEWIEELRKKYAVTVHKEALNHLN